MTNNYSDTRPKISLRSPSIAPSRVGKKPIIGYFDPSIAKEMKMLAADSGISIQALLGEAINDLLEKYKKQTK